ncbi:MAG: hypothetical protein NT062_10190 [Proteobacteria bacterium]|nr:hypothetical protein [Pseudomonadota bacterium]
MQWLVVIAGLAAMKAAFDRGDLEETARQGGLAGAAVVEQALAAPDRATVLAAIVGAPEVEGRAELLPALARLALGPDRRLAIPAARAAATIAARTTVTDDRAREDLADDRATWTAIAMRADRWIEVRTSALEVAAALAEPDTTGFDLAAVLAVPDPVLRGAAVALVPQPAPASARPILAATIANDADPRVALGAAQALCADLVADPPAPILAALGEPGLARLRTLVTGAHPSAMIRDAARCLAASK